MDRRKLISRMVHLRNLIVDEMKESLSSESVSRTYWAKQRRKVSELYQAVDEEWSEFVYKNYRGVFLSERKKQIKIALRTVPGKTARKIDNNRITPSANNYIDGVVKDFVTASDNGLKQQVLLLRLLQIENKKIKENKNIQAALTQAEIEDIITTAEDSTEARNILRDEFGADAIDGKIVVVDTVSGGVRHYDLKYYTEMVMRTTIRDLQSQGTLDAAKVVGADLVQVSSHGTICPICIEFEGKIYSISGKSPHFPPLTDVPPYHPNCLHSISPVFEEALEADGILQEFSDFSNGKTEVHPTDADWIPVTERKIA